MTAVLDRPVATAATRRAPAGSRPAWTRPAVLTLLTGTALLYLWGLGASGDANSFYAAAVQAGTKSWTAFLFGSFDASNFITVDKPPAALWVMELSGRIFGFSGWSMLVPQALEGVAAVGLLYATVRRWSGPVAGLLAGAALAVTPVAVLMFRFNNPDALLTLLLVVGAYATTRAVERGRVGWLLLAGTAVGFGFLTKMLQAFLVLPAFAVVYLLAAPVGLGRRIGHLLAAGAAVVVSAGWWVAIVSLWPASSRPYIGGSTNNSVLELAFGYNGLGRIFGGAGNGGGGGGRGGGGFGGGANASFGGATGITRLFGSSMGTQISWLLPAALVALGVGLWLTRRAPRTDRTRAALLLWGGWLLVTGVVFSYMRGTIHPYYTVVLAPAIGALVGLGAVTMWRYRDSWAGRGGLAGMVAVTGLWSIELLGRTPSWLPGLRYLLLLVTLAACLALLVPARIRTAGLVAAALVGVLGTGAYAVSTASTAHGGSIPTAGPSSSPGAGGGFGEATASSALVSLLQNTDSRWAAATVGSQTAGPLELASGKAVLAIGGFTGSDAAPTLAQFQRYVAEGKVRYFIASGGGMGGGMGGGGTGSQIAAWVAAHYASTTVGGQTVYDLGKQTA